MFNVPKSELIKIIISTFETPYIRRRFLMKSQTKISKRLDSYKKSELIDFITTDSEAALKLEKMNNEYPLNGNPSLYILTYEEKNTKKSVHEKEVTNTNNGKLISVKIMNEFLEVEKHIKELLILYKKRVEFVVADNELDTYGEVDYVESLERAYIWFFNKDLKYAILVTSDYFSVRGIIDAVSAYTRFKLQVPIITEKMLKRLQSNSKLSNASFGLLPGAEADFIDARSITIYDDKLSERKIYENLDGSNEREQFSAYMKKNDYVTTGIGLSRRTAKAWTPSKLKKNEILGVSKNIIKKLSNETNSLDLSKEQDALSYFLLFNTNTFNEKELIKSEIDFYSKLLTLIYTVFKSQENTIPVSKGFLLNCIKHCNRFNLRVVYEYECIHCGRSMHICKDCGSCFINEKALIDSKLICRECGYEYSIEDYTCSCGQKVEMVDLLNHVFIYPELGTLKEVKDVLNYKTRDVVDFNYFVFSFGQLCVIKDLTISIWKDYKLTDFTKWKTIGKIDNVVLSKKDITRIKKYLNAAKEKCVINNYHPSNKDCDLCNNKKLSVDNVKDGKVCLQRLFGLVINEKFDGVHNGYEKADVKYIDNNFGDGSEKKIGIHFKSRVRNSYEVGRGSKNIKGLMSQFVYSLYMNKSGIYDFDIIGISIPNNIETSVLKAFLEVSELFKIDFICLEENNWYRIMAKAEEYLLFN